MAIAANSLTDPSGNIYGVSIVPSTPGTSVVTVTSADGSHTATCTVVVTDKDGRLPVMAVAVTPTTQTVAPFTTGEVTVTFTPPLASNRRGEIQVMGAGIYQYQTLRDENKNVTGCRFTTASAGTTGRIRFTAEDGGTSAEATVTVA